MFAVSKKETQAVYACKAMAKLKIVERKREGMKDGKAREAWWSREGRQKKRDRERAWWRKKEGRQYGFFVSL